MHYLNSNPVKKLLFFSFCIVEHWSSERLSSLPKDTQVVFKLKFSCLIMVPCLVFGFLLYWVAVATHSLEPVPCWVYDCAWADPRDLSFPVSCGHWHGSSWTCIIYLRIFKAASCLGNKYIWKYGWKIGFAYPKVGRALGILGKCWCKHMCVQKRPRSFSSTPW